MLRAFYASGVQTLWRRSKARMEHILRGTWWLTFGLAVELLCFWVAVEAPGLFRLAFLAQVPLVIGLLLCMRGPYGKWAAAALLAPLCRTGLIAESGGPSQGDLYNFYYFGQALGYDLMLAYMLGLSLRMRRRGLAVAAGCLIVGPVLALMRTDQLGLETRQQAAHLVIGTSLALCAGLFYLIRRAVKTVPVEW